jgi:hypothetical protein
MAVTTLIYDGTFEGLLTAVFEVYDASPANRKVAHRRVAY